MSPKTHEELHPILREVTQTYIDLYTHRPDEKNRQKLIALEKLLHEHLEQIQAATRDDG